MPPLGWRKSVDGAKAKNKQAIDPQVYNTPPPVPERSDAAAEALGAPRLGTNQRELRSRREEPNSAMDVDNPSTESTPAPGSTVPQGSSSDHTSNTGMTPPIRSIKLRLKVRPAVQESPPYEPPVRARGRGRAYAPPRRARGGRGRGGRGGRSRRSAVPEVSPPSSEDESPPEEPVPFESEDDASEIASEQGHLNTTLTSNNDTLLESDEDEDPEEPEADPDATAEMDEDLDDLDTPGEIDPVPEDEIDQVSFSTANRAKLTTRQAALVAGGSSLDHVMLQAPSRKAQRTEAEIALRRSEIARKRKHQDAQRLEDEKTETINRLLKKQSARARNKKALDTPVGDPTAEETTNMQIDNRPVIPCYRWISSSKSDSIALTLSLPDVPQTPQILPSQPTTRPPSTCAVSGCTAQRKYRLPGATDSETGACGMDHLKLLKAQLFIALLDWEATMSLLTFTVGERVLCYHGPLLYESKILKVNDWSTPQPKSGLTGTHYQVHYKGWKQSWDEWVPPERLLKWNDTNIALQKSLMATVGASAGVSASTTGASKSTAGTSGGGGGTSTGRAGARKEGRKRGREEDETAKKPEMKIEIPEVLKIQLVDEWEAITKSSRLVNLPREPNVHTILEEFKEWLPTKIPNTKQRITATVLPVVVSGLELYFDKALGANLLYRFERAQYAEMRRKYVNGPTVMAGEPKEMSALYGAEHLLRLVVNLPAMIAQTTMDPESVAMLKEYVEYLLQYLVQERARLFLTEYQHASPHYQNISRA